jgi:hypothetical protein
VWMFSQTRPMPKRIGMSRKKCGKTKRTEVDFGHPPACADRIAAPAAMP